MSLLEVYTDGAYSSSRKQGGIGIVFLKDGKKIGQYAKMYPNTTNNQMEISAMLIALKTIAKMNDVSEIIVHTDSQYVIGCASEGWKRKKNQQLWAQYDEVAKTLFEKNIALKFQWVHGHNGDKYNEIADDLAVTASQEIV